MNFFLVTTGPFAKYKNGASFILWTEESMLPAEIAKKQFEHLYDVCGVKVLSIKKVAKEEANKLRARFIAFGPCM